ncbi:Sphingolipid C4-hydroxylase sur2 [Elasticomyces elasticus]|nr:Sphingolipid C4-hydroxylase sur2 [Elasticomyces elasticus]
MDDASLIPGVRDFYLLLVMPIAVYWLSASVFHLFDCMRWFQAYKIHTYEDGQKRNRATLPQVFRQVVTQQVIQVVFALAVDRAITPSTEVDWSASSEQSMNANRTWTKTGPEILLSDIKPTSAPVMNEASVLPANMRLALQLACAIFVADLWQYGWHRIFHSNKFLYKHVHAVHHRIYVPYSYGALYSSLIEAFLVDTIGTTVTFYLSGLPTLPATWFASLSIIKSVNDHSGYVFPYNPFNYVSSNTTDFHDVHHQNWGMKYNYSQVYLTIWDDLLGTTMPKEEIAARGRRRLDAGTSADKSDKTE